MLAVVTASVVIGSRSQQLAEAGARLRTLAFWRSADFLLNSLLFLLVGLQLTNLVDEEDEKTLSTVAGEALVVALVVFAVRLAWMLVVPAVAHLRMVSHEPTSVPERLLLGWSGMRGAVSLGRRARDRRVRRRARTHDPARVCAPSWSRSWCRGSP